MKKLINKSFILFALMISVLSLPVVGQTKTKHVIIKQSVDGCDSISPLSIWSSEFDFIDVESMHEKLDSIFEKLDEDLNKRIKVLAFDFDSLPEEFSHFNDIDYGINADSIFGKFRVSSIDKRIKELLKSNNFNLGDRGTVDFDSIANSINDSLSVEISTDSIMKNGRAIVKKKIIIDGKEMDEDSPVIIKKFKDDEGNEQEIVIAYKDKKVIHHPGKHIEVLKGSSMPLIGEKRHKLIEEIPLADAELLVKAGISPKVITSPALKPKSINVDVEVEEKFDNKIKRVSLTFEFEDEKGIKVTLLDRYGNVLSNEKVKSTSGTYTKTVEVNEVMAPYYFLIVKNNKLFGRMIR